MMFATPEMAICDSRFTKRMTDKFRTPYESGYVSAIGRAIYIFAIYEWNVVHALEKLRPGFLNKWRFAKKPMTAGKVGKKFKTAVTESTGLARPLSARLKEAAKTSWNLRRRGTNLFMLTYIPTRMAGSR
jgi:hypothetical protein